MNCRSSLLPAFAVLIASIPSWFSHSAYAQMSEADELRAKAAFLDGREAYGAGEYRKALASFQEAYRLSKKPELNYNIGLAADRLRRDQQAVDAYRQYLKDVPTSAHHDEVRARVNAIEASLAERKQVEEDKKRIEAASERQAASIAAQEAKERELQEKLTAAEQKDGSNAGLWIGLSAGAAALVAAIIITVILIGNGSPQYEPSDFGEATFTLSGSQP